MPRKRIPYRNRSPYGWWIGSYLERFEYDDEDRANLNRRCLCWENTIILKARNREEAHRKLIAQGAIETAEFRTSDGRRGRWRFEGATELLPIYDRLRDGAEVLWRVHAGRSVRTIKGMVRAKEKLAIFDDTEPEESP